MVSRFLSLLLLLLPLSAAQAFSSLSSSVDKNPAMLGEAITLTLSADGRFAADAIDFRVLEQDFRVMLPSVSQSTQVINGVTQHNTSWSVSLFASNTGSYRIPAFELNGVRSEPIELTIIESSQAQNRRDLFLEAKLVGYPSAYVQQMLYYDVVIYFSGDLQRGNLTEPALEGAEIQRLGPDTEGTALIDGVRYRTITRRYSLIPQRSGDFVIAPPLFTGEMIERNPERFNYFSRSKTVMAEAEPVQLEVKPQPENFPGRWLIAGLVTLTEEWQPDSQQLKAGEPVTRIITLSAVDVATNQLPDLDQQLPASLRAYQEQPQSRGAERSGRQVAQKVFTNALIASNEGELVLPEVRLPWWNSQTNRLEYAVLPARTLQVTGNAQPAMPLPTLSSPELLPATAANPPWQWNYLSTVLLAAWLLSTVALCWLWLERRMLRANNQAGNQADNRNTVAVDAGKHAFKQACNNNSPKAAEQTLLRLAAGAYPPACRSLGQLAAKVSDPELKAEILKLEQALYSPQTESWQGEALYQAWLKRKANHTSQREVQLQPLYPD